MEKAINEIHHITPKTQKSAYFLVYGFFVKLGFCGLFLADSYVKVWLVCGSLAFI
jgi:hypothetical protein